MSKTVRDLLKCKTSTLWTISPNDTVYQALVQMAEKNIGALPVVENDEVIGIFSERDYARKCILHGKASKETPVSELMSRTVYHVCPYHTIDDCMALLTDKHIRHLPCIENGKLIGILSIGDVVKAVISEQQSAIEQLEDYIVGRR